MTDRESLVTRVNSELKIAQRMTDVFLRTLASGSTGRMSERDQWDQVGHFMRGIARSLQMIAKDVDDLYGLITDVADS